MREILLNIYEYKQIPFDKQEREKLNKLQFQQFMQISFRLRSRHATYVM